VPALSADAAGRPPGGSLQPSQRGSPWPSRLRSLSSQPRLPGKATAVSRPHLAAVAGVAETTVRNAIREARKLGLVTVEERPVTGFRNLPNIVRIVSAEWTAWLRLARKGSIPQGGGCKSPQRTPTEVLVLSESGKTEGRKGCRQAADDLDRATHSRIRAGRRTGRAMR